MRPRVKALIFFASVAGLNGFVWLCRPGKTWGGEETTISKSQRDFGLCFFSFPVLLISYLFFVSAFGIELCLASSTSAYIA